MKRYYKDPQTAKRQNEYCEKQHYQSMCCEGAMDMLLLVWMLHKTPALPYIELLCQYSKQEIFPLLTDKAHNFMEKFIRRHQHEQAQRNGEECRAFKSCQTPTPTSQPPTFYTTIMKSFSFCRKSRKHVIFAQQKSHDGISGRDLETIANFFAQEEMFFADHMDF